MASYRTGLRVHVPGIENRARYRGIIVPGIIFCQIMALNSANGKVNRKTELFRAQEGHDPISA